MRHESSFLKDIASACQKMETIAAALPKQNSCSTNFVRLQCSITSPSSAKPSVGYPRHSRSATPKSRGERSSVSAIALPTPASIWIGRYFGMLASRTFPPVAGKYCKFWRRSFAQRKKRQDAASSCDHLANYRPTILSSTST